MQYDAFIETKFQKLLARHKDGEILSPEVVFAGIDWSQNNADFIAKVVGAKIVTRQAALSATETAKRHAAITTAIGRVPSDPVDYARLYIARDGVQITYRGDLTVKGRDTFNIIDLARGARLAAVELGIGYSPNAVNDAVEEVFALERDKALLNLRSSIEPRAAFDWDKLVRGCFALDDMSADFVIAVLQKFIWQVKRKMFGLPVSYHLMPVIRGAQGKGKSHFVRKLCEPIADLVTSTDFEAVGDTRNIDLWRSFVIFLDEMSKAGKADIDTTKNVITAEMLERRPMRTNNTVRVRQCGTFIGTTNMTLAELIKDETGIRRFIELMFAEPVWGFMDQFDYVSAWRSVHHEDADPMANYMGELARQQAGSRNQGPVESWLRDLTAIKLSALDNLADQSGLITTQQLFDRYLSHRIDVNGGQEREHRSRNAFAHELGRIVRDDRDLGIERYRTNRANGWRITGLRLLKGGVL